MIRIIAFWLCLYVTLSSPFITSSYINFYIRAALEVSLLLLMALYICYSRGARISYASVMFWIGLSFLTYFVTVIDRGSAGNVNGLISSSIKILILLVAIKMAGASTVFVEILRKYWLVLSFVASLSVVSIFFSSTFNLLQFTQYYLGDVNESAPYTYSGNILGNFIPYKFFNMRVPKVSWYFYEPLHLSFLFAVNMVAADKIICNKRYVAIFRVVNILAGLFTFATTFIMVFAFYLCHVIIKQNIYIKCIFILSIIGSASVILYLDYFHTDVLSFTSLGDRINRMDIAVEVLNDNSLLNLFFGNGLGYVGDGGRGISSGILTMLVERGLFSLILVYYIYYKALQGCFSLLMLLIFYSMALEVVFLPLLLIAVSIVYSKTIINKNNLFFYMRTN